MSNGIEEMPDKRNILSNMSERQALLYLQNGGGDEDKNTEKANTLLDYHQYFLYKKEYAHSQLDKNKVLERNKVIKLAQKEFTQIKKNIYIDRKKYVFTDDEAYLCFCNPRKYTQNEAKKILESGYAGKTEEELFGCGQKCLNKIISWECVEHLCPCRASCRNRKFQNHEYADVYPLKTENRGFGLCAGTFLPKGTFVIQYIGEVYSIDSDYGFKKLEEYKDKTCTYLMSLSKTEVIDPTTKGNYARFINHSCEPNCETRKWHVLGEACVGIFTLRDIQPDEELTFNYGFDLFKTVYQKCLCGSTSCRGYLGIVSEDSPQLNHNSLYCGTCKEHWKPSEPIMICDNCKTIYHKKCAKKGIENNSNFTCHHCMKKGILKKGPKEKVIKMEEEQAYDENYEVTDEELGKIRKNLSILVDSGAKLFWDYQTQNAILGTSKTLELKITGTTAQIENVKKMIQGLKELKSDSNSLFTVKLQVPKIFVRKIIGHQNRNLNSYKSKFTVEIDYDTNLITDEIFPIQESSYIQIKGKENNVKAVENEIKTYLYGLKVSTIFLMPTDYTYIRINICNLKTLIDPADLRLRKREYKSERDLKHPFYYISNNNKDIVIIGFDSEIEKGEKAIKNYILRQNTLLYNYSLSFLYPIYLRKQLHTFLNDNKLYNNKKVTVESIEPEYLRRHLSVYIEGKWKDIIEVKTAIWKHFKDSFDEGSMNISGKKHSISEFEQYAFNQEHKLISKSIKNNIIDSTNQIKNWDYISVDVQDMINKKEKNEAHSINKTYQRKQRESCSLLKNFPKTCDRDTKLNYLVNFPPGSYNTIFDQSQNELATCLLCLINEAYDSYKESKLKANSVINTETKENHSIKPSSIANVEEKSSTMINMNQDDDIKPKVDQQKLKEELTGISQVNTEMILIPSYASSSMYLSHDNNPIISNANLMGMHKNNIIGKLTKQQMKYNEEKQIAKDAKTLEEKSIQEERIIEQQQLIESTAFKELSECKDSFKNPKEFQSSSDDDKQKNILKSYYPITDIPNSIEDYNQSNAINTLNENDPLRLAYSFATIQQMNINININEYKNYLEKKEGLHEGDNISNNNNSSSSNVNKNMNDFLQKRETVSPNQKQQKQLYSIPIIPNNKTALLSNATFNNSDLDSMYLQHKTKRSSSHNNISPDKRSPQNSPTHHHYRYHNTVRDSNNSINNNSNNAKNSYYQSNTTYNNYNKRKDVSPLRNNRDYHYSNMYDHRSHSPSPPNTSFKKPHSYYNNNTSTTNYNRYQYSNYTINNSSNQGNNNTKMMSRYSSSSSGNNQYSSYNNSSNISKSSYSTGGGSSGFYSKPYYPNKCYDPYSRGGSSRDQPNLGSGGYYTNNNYRRYNDRDARDTRDRNDRDRDRERDRDPRDRNRDRNDRDRDKERGNDRNNNRNYSHSLSRSHSRSRSRSRSQQARKYGNYVSSFRHSSPVMTYNIHNASNNKKNEQKQSLITNTIRDIPNYKQQPNDPRADIN